MKDIVFVTFNKLVLTMITILVLYPLYFVTIASFSDPISVISGKVILWPDGLNMNGYIKVFNNPDIMIGYKNTIMYALVGTTLNVLLTIAAAYPLSRPDFQGRNLIMMFIVFTMFFSGGLIPTYLVIKDLGLINSFWVMILPNAVSVFNVIIMRTFFQSTIPREIHEASVMDGCSNLRTLIRIVLPLSMPIIAVIVLFYGVGHWNEFFNGLIYLTDDNKYPLQLVLRSILINTGAEAMMDAEAMAEQVMLAESIKYALIIVASAPVLIVYPFLQRYFVKGIMIGAIKG